jgi:hypothetical protein
MFFNYLRSTVPFLSLGVSSSKQPSDSLLMFFFKESVSTRLTPFFLFLFPNRTSFAICDSTSASKDASVSCLIRGPKSPSLPVNLFPFQN